MNKKVYFAGSIRGGRVDADLYKRIINHIQKTDTVMTEHVGDLSLSSLESQEHAEKQIYDRDTAWLRESDLLIAECSCPSLGVGYELAYAERFGKECHIFYDKTKCSLSAMLAGDDYYHIHPYEREEDIYPLLDDILNQ